MKAYSLFYSVIVILLWPLSPFHRKLRLGLWSRLGLAKRIQQATSQWATAPRYWFHFSSSGEFEQCLPVLEALKCARPHAKILISCFSPSGRKAVELESQRRKNENLPWDYFDYAPFDLPFFINPILEALRPEAVIFINRELWPNLVRRCRESGHAVFLIGSFFSRSTQKKNRLLRPVIQELTAVGTVDQESKAYVQALAPAVRVEKLGDPRIERVLNRKKANQAVWSAFFHPPVLLFASLRPADLQALAPHLDLLLNDATKPRIVLVPHDPGESEVECCLKALKPSGGEARRWSHWLRSPDDTSHLVIDSVGQLAELYQIATLVFVGGSFYKRVHNVLEPAAYGCPIFCGPRIENSREALELKSRNGLVTFETGSDLVNAMAALMKDPTEQESRAQILSTYLSEESGSAQRYVEFLLNR